MLRQYTEEDDPSRREIRFHAFSRILFVLYTEMPNTTFAREQFAQSRYTDGVYTCRAVSTSKRSPTDDRLALPPRPLPPSHDFRADVDFRLIFTPADGRGRVKNSVGPIKWTVLRPLLSAAAAASYWCPWSSTRRRRGNANALRTQPSPPPPR